MVETGARYLLDPWRKHQPTFLSEQEADRQRRVAFLQRAVDTAARIGAGVVSLWSGAAPVGAPPDALDTRLVEGLRGLRVRRPAEGGDRIRAGAGYVHQRDGGVQPVVRENRPPGVPVDPGRGARPLTEPAGVEATVARYAARSSTCIWKG